MISLSPSQLPTPPLSPCTAPVCTHTHTYTSLGHCLQPIRPMRSSIAAPPSRWACVSYIAPMYSIITPHRSTVPALPDSMAPERLNRRRRAALRRWAARAPICPLAPNRHRPAPPPLAPAPAMDPSAPDRVPAPAQPKANPSRSVAIRFPSWDCRRNRSGSAVALGAARAKSRSVRMIRFTATASRSRRWVEEAKAVKRLTG